MTAKNGVAFIESFPDSLPGETNTGFSSITLSAEPGTAWTAGDFALDQLAANSGNVSITFGGTNFSQSTSSMPLDVHGLSQYNFLASAGEDITSIKLSASSNNNLLEDLKQVSLNPVSLNVSAVPEPSSWALMLIGFGTIGFAMRGSRRKNRSLA
jgi:hypothetical protein